MIEPTGTENRGRQQPAHIRREAEDLSHRYTSQQLTAVVDYLQRMLDRYRQRDGTAEWSSRIATALGVAGSAAKVRAERVERQQFFKRCYAIAQSSPEESARLISQEQQAEVLTQVRDVIRRPELLLAIEVRLKELTQRG